MRGIMRGDNSLLPDYVTKQIIFIFWEWSLNLYIEIVGEVRT